MNVQHVECRFGCVGDGSKKYCGFINAEGFVADAKMVRGTRF